MPFTEKKSMLVMGTRFCHTDYQAIIHPKKNLLAIGEGERYKFCAASWGWSVSGVSWKVYIARKVQGFEGGGLDSNVKINRGRSGGKPCARDPQAVKLSGPQERVMKRSCRQRFWQRAQSPGCSWEMEFVKGNSGNWPLDMSSRLKI